MRGGGGEIYGIISGMKVFVVAMDCEAQCVVANMEGAVESRQYGRRVVRGRLDGADTAVVVSGVGKGNAAAATQFAIQSGADTIVNVGVAGGLSVLMEIGDIYEVGSAVQYDFDISEVNKTPVGTLNERRTPYIPLSTTGRLRQAVLATGDRFCDGAEYDDLVVNELKCTLRDMEGAAIAQVCETAGARCVSFKCVSDVRGRGSMTRQYAENLPRCIERLAAEVPALFSYV